MKCRDLKLEQLPRLSEYILPDDVNSDSILEINLNAAKDGYMALGMMLTEYTEGVSNDNVEYERLICGMNAIAYIYDRLKGIRDEIASYYNAPMKL